MTEYSNNQQIGKEWTERERKYAQTANNAHHRGMLLALPNVREPLDCDARLWVTHSPMYDEKLYGPFL